mmetsp:Transcript_58988/g.140849  ORF Transcript_58988/g.140849 Transcript_58988/m.140849 type:complete len:306 (+) Transcript_58988:132-1049(+)
MSRRCSRLLECDHSIGFRTDQRSLVLENPSRLSCSRHPSCIGDDSCCSSPRILCTSSRPRCQFHCLLSLGSMLRCTYHHRLSAHHLACRMVFATRGLDAVDSHVWPARACRICGSAVGFGDCPWMPGLLGSVHPMAFWRLRRRLRAFPDIYPDRRCYRSLYADRQLVSPFSGQVARSLTGSRSGGASSAAQSLGLSSNPPHSLQLLPCLPPDFAVPRQTPLATLEEAMTPSDSCASHPHQCTLPQAQAHPSSAADGQHRSCWQCGYLHKSLHKLVWAMISVLCMSKPLDRAARRKAPLPATRTFQ